MSDDSFNLLRSAFWLLVFVVIVYAAITLTAISACVYYLDDVLPGPNREFACDRGGKLLDVWNVIFGAVSGFLFGRAGIGGAK